MRTIRHPQRVEVYENETPILRAKVWDQYPTDYLTTTTSVAIYFYAYDLDSDTPNTALISLPYDGEDVLFDTLQTGSEWDYDSTGYNFQHRLPGDIFTGGGRRYRVEYRFEVYDTDDNDTDIREIALVFLVSVKGLSSV